MQYNWVYCGITFQIFLSHLKGLPYGKIKYYAACSFIYNPGNRYMTRNFYNDSESNTDT